MGMIGLPPSARHVPEDAGQHAAEFATRYASELDYHASNRMVELGIPTDQIGATKHGYPHRAFWAEERTGGGNAPGGRLTVDSGVLNPELISGREEAGPVWAKARLRDRIDAVIAHEWAESLTRDHDLAGATAPYTPLPITDGARHILRAISGIPRER